MRQNLCKRILILVVPAVILSVVYILRESIIYITKQLPACAFYEMYDLYCPACGMTRSIHALLRGQIFTSLSFHIAPVTILLFGSLGYLELVLHVFGKKVRLLPRKPGFYITIFVIFLLYILLRNVFY